MPSSIPFVTQKSLNWQQEGFPDEATAKHWEERGCGIACVRMLLLAKAPTLAVQPENSYWGLIQQGLSLNAYCDKGWIHRGLQTLLETFGIQAQCHRHLTPAQLADILDKGHPCIVSVSVGFRGGQRQSWFKKIPKGGHLVLALGAERNADGTLRHIVCHHPSVRDSWNMPATPAEIQRFANSFSGNCIEIFW